MMNRISACPIQRFVVFDIMKPPRQSSASPRSELASMNGLRRQNVYHILRSYSDGSVAVFGSEESLASIVNVGSMPKYLSSRNGTWVSDIIRNVATGITVVTKHINANGNWRLDGAYLDVFLLGVKIDNIWQSYWLQPDGTITLVEERGILKVSMVETLPEFGDLSSIFFQLPVCGCCFTNPADGISHDEAHRGIMPPYALFECASCAWEAPGTTFYQNGHRDTARLRQLASEFYW